MDSEVLLRCRLCGGKVSSAALACPHCGSRNFKPAEYLKREAEERRIEEETRRARNELEEKVRRAQREKKAAEERARIEKEKEELLKKAEAKGPLVSVIVVKKSTWNGTHNEFRGEWRSYDRLTIDGYKYREMEVYDGNTYGLRIKPGLHTARFEEWDGWGHLVKSEQSFSTTSTTKAVTIYIKEIRVLHKANRIYRIEVV